MMDPEDGPFVEAPPPPVPKKRTWLLVSAVLLITAVGGFLRFYHLERPYVWGDEASSFRRVSGTYADMLRTLERDPFTPLFYSFEWALKNWAGVPLTPFWLRFLPALAGMLMVPAMYFLARQLTSVRTSLVAMLIACCSSWLINYSRDAKMYMTFWLFVTLCAGCFFWWLRKRTWTSWLCWIASGCAMMGLNLWGGVLLALMPIFLLTARRVHWAMGPGFLVGLAVIAAGPVGYYTQFNQYVEKTEGKGWNGISWVEWRNRDADGLDLVRDSASAFLYSFTFHQENFPDNFRRDNLLVPPQPVLVAAIVALTVIGALLALGAAPWRSADTPPPATMPEPWWRSALWLGLWLVVPTYVFYCVSFPTAATPGDWLRQLNGYLGGRWWLFAILALPAAYALARWPRVGTVLLLAMVAIVLAMAGWAFIQHYTAPVGDEHKWYRPVGAITQWLTQIRARWIGWPILVLLPAIAVARSSPTWKGRAGHLLAAVAIVAAVLIALHFVHFGVEAFKADRRQTGMRLTSVWVPRYLGFIWPALAIVVAALLVRIPTWPLRYTAVAAVLGLNLYVAYHRVFDHTEAPLDRVMADIYADRQDSSTRTFVPVPRVSGGPGATTWASLTGMYYLVADRPELKHTPWTLADPNRVLNDNGINARSRVSDAELVMLSRNDRIERIIVWQPYDTPEKAEKAAQDKWRLLARMGPDRWALRDDEVYPVRYHWCWATRYIYVRREFVRK